jgi:hypothetical protein
MPRKRRPSETITHGEYDRLLALQGGGCAICGSPPVTRRLDIDHNHRTGAIRGLLCARCNRALPSEKLIPADSALGPWLWRALNYVGSHEAS